MNPESSPQIWRAIHQQKILDPRRVTKNPGHSAFQRERPNLPLRFFRKRLEYQRELPPPRTRKEN